MKRLFKNKQTLTLLIILLLVIVIAVVYFIRVRKDMSDFGVCYRGGHRIFWGETLYRAEDGHLQYKYSPTSALFFIPLSFLPYEVAKIVWYYLEIVFLVAVFLFSYRILPEKKKKKIFIIVLSFLILAKFIGRELELGQVNTFILFLLTLMLAAALEKKDTRAGVLWALSIFFKPYALVLLPYFLLKKRFKLLAIGIGLTCLGLFLPVFFYGFNGNLTVLKEWVSRLFVSTPPLIRSQDNASLYAFFEKHLSAPNQNLVKILLEIVFLVLAFSLLAMMKIGKARKLKSPEVLEVSFLFILIPLFSPIGWYYNYLYSLLAVVVLLNDFEKFPSLLKYVLIANFVIIGGTLREVLGRDLFHFYARHSLVVVNYLLALFFLFYLRFKKIA